MIYYSNDGIFATLACLCTLEGSVVPRSLFMALIPAILTLVLMIMNEEYDDVQEYGGSEEATATQLWPGATATLTILIGFRTNQAYARFWDGTTLLHQMWGEWFDATSCLVAFSSLPLRTPERVHDVWMFRHTLVRLMSFLHGSALEEIALADDQETGYPVLDIGGLDQPTLRYLRDCKFSADLNFNRVEVLIHMIQTLVVHNQDTDVIRIPPPILSRVFQTLSRGQVNLANCKKITYTYFPFPYTQIIGFLLIAVSVLTPVVLSGVLKGRKCWAFFFTLLPLFGMWALNYIARELEMPFGKDPNDLPLEVFQERMNSSLSMLIRQEADIVPHIDKWRCHLEYGAIKEHMATVRVSHLVSRVSTRKPRTTKRDGKSAGVVSDQLLEITDHLPNDDTNGGFPTVSSFSSPHGSTSSFPQSVGLRGDVPTMPSIESDHKSLTLSHYETSKVASSTYSQPAYRQPAHRQPAPTSSHRMFDDEIPIVPPPPAMEDHPIVPPPLEPPPLLEIEHSFIPPPPNGECSPPTTSRTEPAIRQDSEDTEELIVDMCPNGHILEEFITEDTYVCSVCDDIFPESTPMFGCVECDFDKCESCHASFVMKVEKKKAVQIEKLQDTKPTQPSRSVGLTATPPLDTADTVAIPDLVADENLHAVCIAPIPDLTIDDTFARAPSDFIPEELPEAMRSFVPLRSEPVSEPSSLQQAIALLSRQLEHNRMVMEQFTKAARRMLAQPPTVATSSGIAEVQELSSFAQSVGLPSYSPFRPPPLVLQDDQLGLLPEGCLSCPSTRELTSRTLG